MKVSNLRNVKKIRSDEYSRLYSVVADVDVSTTTGILWWKKEITETRQVFRDETAVNWKWLDTGTWTPQHQVENLYSAYEMKEKMNKV